MKGKVSDLVTGQVNNNIISSALFPFPFSRHHLTESYVNFLCVALSHTGLKTCQQSSDKGEKCVLLDVLQVIAGCLL